MTPNITLVQVDDVSTDSQVCHYDELAEPVKEQFPQLTELESIPVDRAIADRFDDYELIKYTNYYKVIVN
ncbi:hypothetical protein [Natronorubrum sp. FCH18a]|uniref:hypothetical protein n=1 Tax=Natronorubrum sp. FCH18a TaxID=3447018 RepID=UPI003F50EFD5